MAISTMSSAVTELRDGVITLDGEPLFTGAGPELRLEAASLGAFVRVELETERSRVKVKLGGVPSLQRFLACHRYEPFWVTPRAREQLADFPTETQFCLLELASGKLALLVALVDVPLRTSLGAGSDALELVLDSGDPAARSKRALSLYVAVHADVNVLTREGARMVSERLGTGALRRDKPLPDFAEDFGWCTWDAFYQDVSQEKVREGLESFRKGGVQPRFLILDDGWQQIGTAPTGERRLTGFGVNEAKFPGGLSGTVELAKREFGVRTFLVWHAVHGYWGGVDADALPSYGVSSKLRWYSPEILAHAPNFNVDHWGAVVGTPAPEALERFYDDYHAGLSQQGVDGVKVDNQASVEGVSHGDGGRVSVQQTMARALEKSTQKHFGGRLINCMSCSSERIYAARHSTLLRSSVDFWPEIPASHGLHVYTNAVFGLFFGEFVQPDWDMFQSGHRAGPFHAVARAVSGGPVYVSDKPDGHDFELLRTLVLSDGSVLRARGVAVPTRDCIFGDPLSLPVLFKVWNENAANHVLGVFNARYSEQGERLEGSVSPSDVPGLAPGEYALYFGRARRLAKVAHEGTQSLTLGTLEAEIVTIAALDRGVAALGLADKLNGGAALTEAGWDGDEYALALRDGGELVLYSTTGPREVRVGARAVPFAFTEGKLLVNVESRGACRVRVAFRASPALT
jgi:raffinose synthase